MSPKGFPAPRTVKVPKPAKFTHKSEDVQAGNFAKAGKVGEPAPTFYPDQGSVKKAGGRI